MILYQVNRILCKPNLLRQFCRQNSTQSLYALYPLESRRLLKVSGSDTSSFLQGLITNDMRHFDEGAKSIYAMFLNNKGRVLYDTLIYKWQDENTYIIECDKNTHAMLQKHLKLYKLRRILEIFDVNPEHKLWTLIPKTVSQDIHLKVTDKVNLYKDPRLPDLGFRIISAASLSGAEVAENIGINATINNNEDGYKYLRYKLGVSEGCEELPPGTCIPLEVNCDYLHGVSFHKGCYVGQELTARVHHTGIVRKRILPLKFTDTASNLELDSVISVAGNPKSNLGKLKGFIQDYGLGLLRIKETLEAKTLSIGNHSAESFKPNWWPIEAPKEKVNVPKTE